MQEMMPHGLVTGLVRAQANVPPSRMPADGLDLSGIAALLAMPALGHKGLLIAPVARYS